MSKKNNNQTSTSLIRAVLSTEVKFIIGVVGFVIGVVSPYYQMRQDLALIQKDISIINSNHLMHTQDLTQQVKDIFEVVQAQQNQIIILQTNQSNILKKLP